MSHITPRFRYRSLMLLLVIAGALGLAACGWFEEPGEPLIAVPGGDPAIGKDLIFEYGCHSCHSVPGVNAADAHVGPPLDAWAERRYIAGLLPNEPDNLVAWIVNPPRFEPDTAMPTLGVSEQDAADIAAYLYTLTDD